MNTWVLTARELYFLCEFAGCPWPVMFDMPATATDYRRHDADNGVVVAALTERGLADGRGPLGRAAELVTALRYGDRAHLVVRGGNPVTGTAFLNRSQNVLLVQDGEQVVAHQCTSNELPDVLMYSIAAVRGANSMPVSLPRAALTAALDARDEYTLGRALRAVGVDHAMQRRWMAQLHPVLSAGQFVVDPSREVRWLDTVQGRYSLSEADGWISANPLPPSLLRRRLGEVCAE